jgi:hypothetical protein
MEFVVFKEICERGLCATKEILTMPEFEGVLEGVPPGFMRPCAALHRLQYILHFIEGYPLETRRKPGIKVRRRMTEEAALNSIRVSNIAYNENGSPKLPIHVSEVTSVSDLGRIVFDRRGFHSEHWIYPAGFRSSRLCFSTLNPSEKVWYTCEILDTGGELPLFRVTMDSHPDISFEGNSPGSPWTIIANKVMEMRGNGHPRLALPGPEYFGLASPAISYLIQQMDGADKCADYVMKPFEEAPPKPQETQDSPMIAVPPIACDANGRPQLPIHLSKLIYVSDLGHVVTDRRGFHSARCIYPAGFRSSRLYFSTISPSESVWYTSEILDTGGELPVFRVTMDSHPEISFEGSSLRIPWSLIVANVIRIRGHNHPSTALPGAEYFGLRSAVIGYLIQQMEGAEKCVRYVMKRFAPPKIITVQEASPLAWTPAEDRVLTRLYHPGSNDWQPLVTALPRRTMPAIASRWTHLQQKGFEDDGDKTAQPERQGNLEFPKVARAAEPMMPFVGFPNSSRQSQTEAVFPPSIQVEQRTSPTPGFPGTPVEESPIESIHNDV